MSPGFHNSNHGSLIKVAAQESKAAAEQQSSGKGDVKEAVDEAKQAPQQGSALKHEVTDGDSDSDVEIVEEQHPEKGSHSGFYRAVRETGRSNVLLALQVRQ